MTTRKGLMYDKSNFAKRIKTVAPFKSFSKK